MKMDGPRFSPSRPVRLFLPYSCLCQRYGYLLGVCNNQENVVCITAIVHCSLHKAQDLVRHTKSRVNVLGVWAPEESLLGRPPPKIKEVWLQVTFDAIRELPLITFYGSLNRELQNLVVLYEPQDLLSSYFMFEHETRVDDDFIQTVLHCNNSHRRWAKKMVVKEKTIPDCTDFVHQPDGFVVRTIQKCNAVFSKSLVWVVKLMEYAIIDNRLSQSRPAQFVGNIVCAFCQMRHQVKMHKQAALRQQHNPKEKLRWWNVLSGCTLDILLGLLLLLLLLRMDADPAASAADSVMDWAQDVVSTLKRLLHWLMGAPAGLKLNSQLDQFLGRFFLYHIQLWIAYLSLLKPVLPWLLWCVAYAGTLGVSMQLSLLQDLLAMLTLHIYCFYVYAARLYSLQVSGLGSLWRLFRGKKWNVLRQRVDSAQYDVDQLFMGTLLFTILLFLLPTTAMYYAVFTALRLVIVVIQGLLFKLRCIINQLPVYAILGKVLGCLQFSARVCFDILAPAHSQQPLCLALKLQPAKWGDIWGLCEVSQEDDATHHSWRDFLHFLITGRLIYPWIKPYFKH